MVFLWSNLFMHSILNLPRLKQKLAFHNEKIKSLWKTLVILGWGLFNFHIDFIEKFHIQGARIKWIAMLLSFFAAQVSPCMLKIAIHFKTSRFSNFILKILLFTHFFNELLFGVASFCLLNILNITLNINTVIYKWTCLLLCLVVSWHASL